MTGGISFFPIFFMSAHASRFLRTSLAVFLSITFLPMAGLAAEPSADTVSRGEFIRSAVKTLAIPLDDDALMPTERMPKALLPYIGAAKKRGALAIFGTSIDHTKAITRGEALVVLMKLQSLS